MICPNCGREISENDAFCPFCGRDTLNKNYVSLTNLTDELLGLKKSVKSVMTLAILSIIFGGYLGLGLAIWNLSKISLIRRTAPLPQNVNRLNEYERLKGKLTTAKILSIIGIVISVIWIVIYPYIAKALEERMLSLT